MYTALLQCRHRLEVGVIFKLSPFKGGGRDVLLPRLTRRHALFSSSDSDVLKYGMNQRLLGRGLSDPISIKPTALVFPGDDLKNMKKRRKKIDCTLYFLHTAKHSGQLRSLVSVFCTCSSFDVPFLTRHAILVQLNT